MSNISGKTRQELIITVGERYRESNRGERRRILDEFVNITGYHRKHAIRVLSMPPRRTGQQQQRGRLYGDDVRETLTVLWEAADRVCGKRLKALLPILLPALERHGHMKLDDSVRALVLSVSAATIDRLLSKPRAATNRRRQRGVGKPAIRREVAIRTFGDWKDPPPGFLEIDLVAHCGDNVSGAFVNTLSLTDVATGWTECIPLVVREATLVADAIESLRLTMPFPLRGIDCDNGGEFINETLVAYCRQHAIEFTRSRPHRKNDQAWIEQKNGAVVRRLVGYGRLEGVAAAETLGRLYAASRLFVNFFQPSFKLAEKKRDGARVHKRYHPPETPCARLLASPSIDPAMKERLQSILVTLDPLKLLDEVRTMQEHIAGLAAGEVRHILPHRDADLENFFKCLSVLWKAGEVRPSHRKGPKPARYWRTRPDRFAAVWPQVVVWLGAEPERTARDLLARLQDEYPGVYNKACLRTLQRRVKEWRRDAARRLIFAPTSAPPAGEPMARPATGAPFNSP